MNKFDYRLKDINLSLKKIGLRKGMDVFIHSNLAFFGKPNFRIKNNSLEKAFKMEAKNLIECANSKEHKIAVSNFIKK